MFSIVVNEKGGEQKRLEFDKPEVTIGRVQGNDIILPKGNVSKRHSRIVLKDGKFIIVDLKSTNGTYVNGRKITSPLVVKGSDKIYIGDFILSIEEAQAGAGEEAAPARQRPSTIPPPPPRRPAAEAESEDPATADRESPNTPLPSHLPEPDPEPARAARPSAPPAPVVAPPAVRPTAAPMPSPVRPPTGQTGQQPRVVEAKPAVPPSRPSQQLPTVRPAAQPSRPAPVAAAKRPVAAVDDSGRAKLVELKRELASRLFAAVGPNETDGGRVETTATELMNELVQEGSVPPGSDNAQLVRDAVSEVIGFGPLDELVQDDTVRSISVPRFDRVFVDRGSGLQANARWFSSPDALTRVLDRLALRAGRRNGELRPIFDAIVPGGFALTAVFAPLSAHGPAVSLRRARPAPQLAQLVTDGVLSQGMADLLEIALKGHRNVVVSGPAGSGRSTLIGAIGRIASEWGERVVVVEPAHELDLGAGAWTTLVGGRDALSAAIRLRAQRLVVGDVHGAEALDVLTALVGGAEGVVCGIRAGSAREALARLESLARMAPESPGPEVLADQLGRGVQLVVQMCTSADGEPRVQEILEVTPGGSGDDASLQTLFGFKADAAGGRFSPTGHIPAWAEGAPPSTFRS